MKIGILSMQRVPNYGSFLQAYGLKNTLESMGHEVIFIDYKEGKPIVPYSKKARLKYKLLNISVMKYLNDWYKYNVAGKKLFDYKYRLEYLDQLGVGYRRKYHTAVDAAVIGSDEVFNCLQSGFNVGFSPMLFGQNINAGKVIGYAASFGYTDLNGLDRYNLISTLTDYLKSFTAISVRDDNSKAIVEKLTDCTPSVNLDPVLISEYELPEIEVPYHDYVILYTYKSRGYSENDKKAILDFCQSHHKILISIGSVQDWVSNKVEASPLELLVYIKNADFIITDTFHGTVFSIKYNKPFATLIRDNNRQKLGDLLHRLDKEDRTISSFEELSDIYGKPIDYGMTNDLIECEKKRTMEYLSENLGSGKEM